MQLQIAEFLPQTLKEYVSQVNFIVSEYVLISDQYLHHKWQGQRRETTKKQIKFENGCRKRRGCMYKKKQR